MKTNIKLSSKMHLFIIISSAVVAIGLMVGLICQFVANGYFNYGADWASYKSVTVSSSIMEFVDEGEVKEVCENAFKDAGVNYYSESWGEQSGDYVGNIVVYKFTKSTNQDNLKKAVEKIETDIKDKAEGNLSQSFASWHDVDGLLGSGKAIWRGAVALASVIVLHFIYFAVRYKLSMACAAALADVHNLAIFISLLSITRIPVGSSIVAFAVLTVLITAIGTCFLFDRMRKNNKNEDLKKLDAFELVDLSANESFKINLILPACLAVAAVVLFVLSSISALSVLSIISPILCAIICFISCAYGTLFFIPSVYSRFKVIGDGFKKKQARAPKEKTSK